MSAEGKGRPERVGAGPGLPRPRQSQPPAMIRITATFPGGVPFTQGDAGAAAGSAFLDFEVRSGQAEFKGAEVYGPGRDTACTRYTDPHRLPPELGLAGLPAALHALLPHGHPAPLSGDRPDTSGARPGAAGPGCPLCGCAAVPLRLRPALRAGRSPADRAEQLTAWVTVNCGRRDVRVAEIAAVVGLSPRGLQFLCRRHFGRSPLRLLRDAGLHRVREAMDSAETAPATMAEAAAMAGFGRPDRFAAAYRARYGEDPRLPAGGGALPGPVNGGEQGGAGPVSATGTRTEAGAHVVGPAAGKGRGAGASTAGKEPGEFPHPGPVTRDCPLQCLLELLDLKAGNPLMRGRGIRVGPPETVGDVLDLYASRRLRDITGLGPRRIAQIAVALEAAGFDLRPRPCPRPGDGGRPAVSPAGKDPGS